MQTQKLNKKLEILKLHQSSGNMGEVIESYVHYAYLYSTVLNESGRKAFATDGLTGMQYVNDKQLWLRYNPSIKRKGFRCAFMEEDDVYDIVEVNHVGQREATIITIRLVN